MQYAVSDIHGCYDKYAELLRRISFRCPIAARMRLSMDQAVLYVVPSIAAS